MANRFTTSPADVGLDGLAPSPGQTAADQLAADSAACLADWGEWVTYNVAAPDNAPAGTPPFTPRQVLAVVTRDPPASVTEDGKALADMVEVVIANDPVRGVTAPRKGRDTVTLAGRYGGPIRPHTVVAFVGGDAGLWTLRVR